MALFLKAMECVTNSGRRGANRKVCGQGIERAGYYPINRLHSPSPTLAQLALIERVAKWSYYWSKDRGANVGPQGLISYYVVVLCTVVQVIK